MKPPRGPFYSEIPPRERSEWSDAELSGAIWDEAVELAGGYALKPVAVTSLPFGFRAVLSEGCVRAHVEGDGLVTTIWNDNGTAIFVIAADCHERIGNTELAVVLREIHRVQSAWEKESNKRPRELDHEEFVATAHAQSLEPLERGLLQLADDGFTRMMAYLRAQPELLDLAP